VSEINIVPHSFEDLAVRLLLATLCGAAIGVNRELRVKPAGLRTHALVALGAAVVTMCALLLGVNAEVHDPSAASRVLQGVLTGIGFIGGGAILRRQDRQGVHGLTTAASIWVVAAAGVAVGIGLWPIALMATALALAVLVGGARLDLVLRSTRQDMTAAKKQDLGQERA
jgi:putative Mg2+ transporter-C (MgtC) family protein